MKNQSLETCTDEFSRLQAARKILKGDKSLRADAHVAKALELIASDVATLRGQIKPLKIESLKGENDRLAGAMGALKGIDDFRKICAKIDAEIERNNAKIAALTEDIAVAPASTQEPLPSPNAEAEPIREPSRPPSSAEILAAAIASGAVKVQRIPARKPRAPRASFQTQTAALEETVVEPASPTVQQEMPRSACVTPEKQEVEIRGTRVVTMDDLHTAVKNGKEIHAILTGQNPRIFLGIGVRGVDGGAPRRDQSVKVRITICDQAPNAGKTMMSYNGSLLSGLEVTTENLEKLNLFSLDAQARTTAVMKDAA